MESLTTLRLVGLGCLVLIFIATVLLMPRIFGENPSRETGEKPDPTPGS
ncbi:MAG: hypothetical protein HYR51_06630 [Candidatus Rokubacteria bacterium]|nr:hypothetical protein [Candidatus Rokubacteria bacterium]